jgi:hypothetical protein
MAKKRVIKGRKPKKLPKVASIKDKRVVFRNIGGRVIPLRVKGHGFEIDFVPKIRKKIVPKSGFPKSFKALRKLAGKKTGRAGSFLLGGIVFAVGNRFIQRRAAKIDAAVIQPAEREVDRAVSSVFSSNKKMKHKL